MLVSDKFVRQEFESCVKRLPHPKLVHLSVLHLLGSEGLSRLVDKARTIELVSDGEAL